MSSVKLDPEPELIVSGARVARQECGNRFAAGRVLSGGFWLEVPFCPRLSNGAHRLKPEGRLDKLDGPDP